MNYIIIQFVLRPWSLHVEAQKFLSNYLESLILVNNVRLCWAINNVASILLKLRFSGSFKFLWSPAFKYKLKFSFFLFKSNKNSKLHLPLLLDRPQNSIDYCLFVLWYLHLICSNKAVNLKLFNNEFENVTKRDGQEINCIIDDFITVLYDIIYLWNVII